MNDNDTGDPDLKKSKRRAAIATALKIGAPLVAIALALIPLPAGWVERFYSTGIYPWLQSWLTPLSNRLPFSVGDVLFLAIAVALPAWWIIRIRSARGRRLKTAASLGLKSLIVAATIYLVFLILWGFNYERQPLMGKLDYDDNRVTGDSSKLLKRATTERLNADSKSAHGSPWPADDEWQRELLGTFNQIVIELGNSRGIARGSAKTTLGDFLLGKSGVGGYTNPFGLEVVLNSDLLPIEKPFTLAHEWAHLAGFADESEANFVALLACARSDLAAVRYSAWLALYGYLPSSANERAIKSLPDDLPPLNPEVVADLRAIEERASRRLSPAISRAQGRIYDGFLKANRVEAGIGSYGLFVRLMLGTRFETEWSPVRR